MFHRWKSYLLIFHHNYIHAKHILDAHAHAVIKSSTMKRIMKKVDGMITVRSPRFLTALLFLRANLRSFVAKQNYMTKVLWCCVPFCFCVKLSEFICSYEYKIEIEKEKEKREVKWRRKYVQKTCLLTSNQPWIEIYY